jgi:hypothetical protein
MAVMAEVDLTLAECCQRWGISSNNTIKARAAALGIKLIRQTSTRTLWPGAAIALGDALNDHLRQPGGTLRNLPPSLMPAGAGTDATDGMVTTLARREPEASLTPAGAGTDTSLAIKSGSSEALSLTAAGAGTDGLLALIEALRPPTPADPDDPLGVVLALRRAARLAGWLGTTELAALLRMAPATIRGWSDGHRPRPGFALQRRKEGGAVWWRVVAVSDASE